MIFETKVTINVKDLLNSADFLEDDFGNYSDADDSGEVCDYQSSNQFDAKFKPILYTLALVVGLLGNGLVLVVLWKKRTGLNVTDIFILHLSLADILLLLTLPFWAVEAVMGWIFHTPLCKLAGALFKINFYCGIYMLTCISVDRYLSIVHAVQMYSRKKPAVIHCCCLMVWFFCFLLSIPEWMLLGANYDIRFNKTECVPEHFSNSRQWFNRLLCHVLGFALPGTIILFCYSSIAHRLQIGSQCMQKKRAIRVIVALVLAFFISWTPYNITLIVDTVHTNNFTNADNQTSCGAKTALEVALTATSTIAYFHCCVNPLLYAFVGVKFRQSLLEMLKPLGFTLKGRAGVVSRKSSVWSESGETSHTSAF
ncbi:hypothetical protein DNTS_025559 [Danionella cerebrum]|uniref:C-X-C chemokine receptor type 3 n=1 Tax=Danionella cerebrum TaxID=2873325 RepID=A0A553RQJ0_9TELE|nr:hypothetical protein DNTS_025559 [Danionella translucida]